MRKNRKTKEFDESLRRDVVIGMFGGIVVYLITFVSDFLGEILGKILLLIGLDDSFLLMITFIIKFLIILLGFIYFVSYVLRMNVKK